MKSPIDELFNSLYGYYPTKAGTSLEMLSSIAYAIIKDISVKHNQMISSNFCNTEYQVDGLAENKDGDQEIIEAKDYTIRNKPVGRGDLQKFQGALTDIGVCGGKFVSATDYTKDAKEYACGTQKNPKQVPIDLLHVRPSTIKDEDGRIAKIVCNITVRGLDITPDCIKPIFNEETYEFLKQNKFNVRQLKITMQYVFDESGKPKISIADYSKELNKYVDLNNHEQTTIHGKTPMVNAYMQLENEIFCPIGGLEYDISIYDFNFSFSIDKSGRPVLLIKSQDNSINKLITDEELKQYRYDINGNLVKS